METELTGKFLVSDVNKNLGHAKFFLGTGGNRKYKRFVYVKTVGPRRFYN